MSDVNAVVAGDIADDSQQGPVSGAADPMPDPVPEPASTKAEVASDSVIPPAATRSEAADQRVGPVDAQRFLRLSEIVISHTVPSSAKSWGFLLNGMGTRIELSPLDFVESLETEFGKSILSELGLHERVGDELRPPKWIVENAVLYATIDKENRTFKFQAVVQPEFPRTALDCALLQASQESPLGPDTLFITDYERSADILRRLGLQSVTCHGLESLNKSDLDKIFRNGHDHEFGWRYYLLLLDFDVMELQNKPADPIGEVIQRLANAEEAYRIDPIGRFGICRPEPDEFQRLENVVAVEDAVQIARLFHRWSLTARAARLGSWYSYLNLGPITFSVAHEELR